MPLDPGSAWWIDECGDTHGLLVSARRLAGYRGGVLTKDAEAESKKMIRRVKRAYWRAVVADINDSKDLYRVTRWTSRQSTFRPSSALQTLQLPWDLAPSSYILSGLNRLTRYIHTVV